MFAFRLALPQSLVRDLANRIEEEIDDTPPAGGDLGRHGHARRQRHVAFVDAKAGALEFDAGLKEEAALFVGVASCET